MTGSPNDEQDTTLEVDEDDLPLDLNEAVAALRQQALDENTDADGAVAYLLSMQRQIVGDVAWGVADSAVEAALDQADATLQEWRERDPGGLLLALAEAHRRSEAGFDERKTQREAFLRRLSSADHAAEPAHSFLAKALQLFAEAHRDATGEAHLDIFGTDSRVQLRNYAGEVQISDKAAFIASLADDPDLRSEWAAQEWSLTARTVDIKKALAVELVARGGDVDTLRDGTAWVGPRTTATIRHAS